MKRSRRLNKRSIDYILAFCEKLKKEREAWECGREKDIAVDRGYITSTMLMGIYNILINEGYTKKHLDNYFFFDCEFNKHKERTKGACEFYHINQPSEIERFFNEDPAGIKLRREIDNLKGDN